jgi:hypothetical protein
LLSQAVRGNGQANTQSGNVGCPTHVGLLDEIYVRSEKLVKSSMLNLFRRQLVFAQSGDRTLSLAIHSIQI